MKHIKLFETHSQYETYIEDENAVLPNLSYCEDNDDHHLSPDEKLIVKYNVTSEDLSTPMALFSNPTNIKKIEIDTNLTGCEVAEKILKANGLDDIDVVEISGELTDNYNNSKRMISLSSDIYNGRTIASSSVAAHECGHAIQYKVGYVPIKIRNTSTFKN